MVSFEELLEAGVHFGHLKKKWNPAMAPYIFMERGGIHIIDLHKTAAMLETAAQKIKEIAKQGRKILFVATKKQAKEIVAEKVQAINMPYITERWSGGMLTNFPTVRKAVKKMSSIEKMESDGTLAQLSKREKLQISRQYDKLKKNLGSIADLTKTPAALFVIDVTKEKIAVKEAHRLHIPVFGMVDTNSNPNDVDFVIPANDDAAKSISIVLDVITKAIAEGVAERKTDKDSEGKDNNKANHAKPRKTRLRKGEAKAEDGAEAEVVNDEAAEN
jgi:small subunit ribosomal protein S2